MLVQIRSEQFLQRLRAIHPTTQLEQNRLACDLGEELAGEE